MSIRNSLQELVDQILNDSGLLSDCRRANLFVIAHHHYIVTQVKCNQGHYVALAGLIDNDYVKARRSWIKVLHHSGKGHDPNRNGAPTLCHLMRRFRTQTGRAYTGALADLSYGVQ